MSQTITLRSILQCPHCGFKVTERMPAHACVIRLGCPACQRDMLGNHEGCVFCRFGSTPGPAAQRGECTPTAKTTQK